MPWKSSVKLVFTLSLQVAESTCPSRVAVGLSVLSSASLAQTSNSLRCPFTLSLSVKVVFKRIPSCVVSSDDASSETTAPVSCAGSAANALVGIMVVIIKKVRNHARILEANLFSLRSICSSSFADKPVLCLCSDLGSSYSRCLPSLTNQWQIIFFVPHTAGNNCSGFSPDSFKEIT